MRRKSLDGRIQINLRYRRRRGEGALYAIVDESDWKLAGFPWRAMRSTTGAFYAYVPVPLGKSRPMRSIYLHREVANAPNGMEVDHRNGDTLDCRRSNLRLATHAQNSRNTRLRRKNNTSGFKGVSASKNGRWRSYIVVDARQIHLGTYGSGYEASGAYDSAAMSIFGEFARPNERF